MQRSCRATTCENGSKTGFRERRATHAVHPPNQRAQNQRHGSRDLAKASRVGSIRPMRAKSFLAKRVRNVLIYVHTAAAPDDHDWDQVLSFYEGGSSDQKVCTLVYTEGGAPNAAQRARLNARLGSDVVRIAVLTSSAVARAAGTAVTWFRPHVRVFRPHDEEGAMDHLQLSPEGRQEVRETLQDMKRSLGIK